MALTPEILIALLRHGETEGGARFRGSTDDPLSLAGWEQMRIAVGKEPWQRIVASPLKRCAEFADGLAARLGIPLEIDDRLREMHFGGWEGKTAAELMESDGEALTRFWRDPASYTPPGAEPLRDFQVRVLAAWSDLRLGKPTTIPPLCTRKECHRRVPAATRRPRRDKRGAGGDFLPPLNPHFPPFDKGGNARRVLLVAHGGVIRTILCQVLGHPLERLLELELEVGHGALRWVRLRADGTGELLAEDEA